MDKLYPDAASALDGLLRDGLLIACGGFGLGLFVRQGQLFLDLFEVLQGVDFHRRS